MPVPPVVINNTPLVSLWSLGRLDLLRDLFGLVWIPTAVETEFLATEQVDRQQILANSPWLQVVSVRNRRHVLGYIGLDKGEAEVLALAVEQQARLVIMDERKGRRYATRLGLPLTGTLGVLLLAKEQGHITAVAPLLQQLLQAGLYFSTSLIEKILQLADES